MKLTYVDEIPKKYRRDKHNLQDLLKEFVDSGKDIARVDFNEMDYKTPSGCRKCIAKAIVISKLNVRVLKRGNEIYLMKKYIEKVK